MSALRFLQQENARLQAENKQLSLEKAALQRQIAAIQELYRVMQRLESIEDPFELLDELLNRIIKLMGATDGSISSLDRATGELKFEIVHGDLARPLRGYRIKSNTGIAGWVVNHKEPIIVNNPRQDWRFSLKVDEMFNFFTRSIACVPVLAQTELIGVIQLLNKQAGDFTETDIVILEMLSQVVARVLAGKPNLS